jgi:TLC ATP/ADP transporter
MRSTTILIAAALIACVVAAAVNAESCTKSAPSTFKRPRVAQRAPSSVLDVRDSSKNTISRLRAGAVSTAHGRVRNAIFPVFGRDELNKFFALGGIKFFIIFVLTLTRDLKDTLVVTNCGAESISFLKVRFLSNLLHLTFSTSTASVQELSSPQHSCSIYYIPAVACIFRSMECCQQLHCSW